MGDLLRIEPAATAKYPSYHALVLYVTGLRNGPSDARTLDLLQEAEESARETFGARSPAEHPHLAAWREVFRGFGVKPQRTMNSVEALIARVLKGGTLPAANRLADAYNAVSVRFVVPCGGEDMDAAVGHVTLRFAEGNEPFETFKDGAPAVENPAPGEVVWADEAGVTCRAWNWRQGTRTRLNENTANAYFLFDALAPMTSDELDRAGDALEEHLLELSPGCSIGRAYLGAGRS